MMKIVVVVFTGNSGVTHYSYNLCNALSGIKNIQVELITSASYELEGFKHNFHVRKLFRRSRQYLIDIWKFIFYILNTKPDIVHFQSTLKFPFIEKFVIGLFKKSGIKNIVFTVHDALPHKQRFYHALLYRWFYNSIPKIIVHSHSAHRIVVNELDYKGKIKIIPHGEYSFFRENNSSITCAEARLYLGFDLRKKIILFFGHIRPDKGIAYLIESFSKVVSIYHNTLLAIVGSPEESFQKYTTMIRNFKIEDKVFTRLQHIPVEDIPFYITAADFLVLPYIESTTSGIAQLAYGFSKPIIATDVGNIPEVIEDGETGFIVPPRNVDKLAEKMLILLNNEMLLKKMSYTIQEKSKKFSWENIACDTVNFYSS